MKLKRKITYQDLEPVKQGWSISQASILFICRVVLWHITIRTGTQEHFLYAAGERITQVLHWVHHHTPIDLRT